MLLNTMNVEIVSLKGMKELYAKDIDFKEAWKGPWSMN